MKPILFILVFLAAAADSQVSAQAGNPADIQASRATQRVESNGAAAAPPDWLPSRIPLTVYQKWRKYGEWDFKQFGAKYRESTMFNFGATARAAGLDKNSAQELFTASRATPDDVVALDDPNLPRTFRSHASRFEALRRMAEKDAHVLRVAFDYTEVDEATQRLGDKVGLSATRWDEYRALFRELSLSEGLLRSEDFPNALLLIYTSRGLCTGGSSSGYIYSVAPVAPLVTAPAQALDAEARKKRNTEGPVYVFTALSGHWYAFYQIN